MTDTTLDIQFSVDVGSVINITANILSLDYLLDFWYILHGKHTNIKHVIAMPSLYWFYHNISKNTFSPFSNLLKLQFAIKMLLT